MISYVHFPVLAVMVLFLGAFLIEIFGSKIKLIRNTLALAAAGISFALIAALVKPVLLDGEIISYWMGNWEPVSGYAIGIGYEVDALSLFFALLVVLTFLLSGIYSMRYMELDHHLGHYYTLYLMLSGSTLGLVLTGDIFNMFVMIEIMTFAAVALTAFRTERMVSLEAGFKYLVIGAIGSSFTLFGIALVYARCHTLNMAQVASMMSGSMDVTTMMAFAFMFIGLATKSYIVPFHTPAADSYTTAPTSISMIFAGMVNKAGVYGMLRLVYIIFQTMDRPAIQMLITIFGTITMFVGVTMALAQHNFKRLLAFHSISQIGYVLTAAGLGTALGLTGSLFHVMNHTLFKGLLFLCAGAMFYSAGTMDLDKLGGLSKKMPATTICFLIGAFSISGLPPFNGFASKWIIYQAAYTKAVESGNFVYAFVTIVAVLVSVMTLASFIKVIESVFFGQLPETCRNVKEVPFSMRLPMYIMSALCVVSGIFYNGVEKYLLRPAVNALLNVSRYIDTMLGSGYAAQAGVVDMTYTEATFSYWNPMLWLVLFVVVFTAVFIVILLGNSQRSLKHRAADNADSKHSTFFGGEESVPSHAGGSDLFWGFKYDLKGYFHFMESMHSGSVSDYAMWVIAATAVVILFVFIFV